MPLFLFVIWIVSFWFSLDVYIWFTLIFINSSYICIFIYLFHLKKSRVNFRATVSIGYFYNKVQQYFTFNVKYYWLINRLSEGTAQLSYRFRSNTLTVELYCTHQHRLASRRAIKWAWLLQDLFPLAEQKKKPRTFSDIVFEMLGNINNVFIELLYESNITFTVVQLYWILAWLIILLVQ